MGRFTFIVKKKTSLFASTTKAISSAIAYFSISSPNVTMVAPVVDVTTVAELNAALASAPVVRF